MRASAMHVLFLLSFFCSVIADNPNVETSLGKIQGYHNLSYDGRTYSAFEGIPFAKPPIGELRFEPPQEVEPWTGVWNANTPHECIQPNFFGSGLVGSEDCLYLNVFVPKKNPIPNENLDVLVHIHRGAFMVGSPVIAGPKLLMDRDIVYVTVAYRLNVMGFLSTGNEVVPGNNGMKDQVLALKWVQQHIANFGGNPNSITITGGSAGGASVHLHYFSPLSKGLFHRGMSQSGTALAPWAIQDNPLEKARLLGARVGCTMSCRKDLVKCLKQRPAKELLEHVYSLSPYSRQPIVPFAPVVEKPSKGAFLTELPYLLLKKGDVAKLPWLSTYTTGEGGLGLMDYENNLAFLNENWDSVLPYYLDYNRTVEDSDKKAVADAIKKFYFNNEEVTKDNLIKLVRLYGHRYFDIPFEVATKMQSHFAPVYGCLFGYHLEIDNSDIPLPIPDKKYGVTHGGDGYFLYDMEFQSITIKELVFSGISLEVKDVMLDIVTSFAKSGIPSVKGLEWPPIKPDDFKYLNIDEERKILSNEIDAETRRFWDSLPIKEYGSVRADNPIVETSLGKIQGHHKLSYDGRTYSAFEGIPFAKPPIGELRFEPPQEVEPWSGVWNANTPQECIQPNFFGPGLVGSEDCLYLNVFVPKKQPIPNENLDVVVHIHGGAFMVGSPALAGPKLIMDRDVVYVTVAYRLNVMGFLSTGNEVVSGNNGMKDQVLALKWVQQHIANFGGNPNSVTITGLSAGGGSVHLHYFSPLSKGLFHRGMSQSGTGVAPWVIQDNPLEKARLLGARVGCTMTCRKDLVKCLKQRPAKELLEHVYSLSPYPRQPLVPFAPVVEKPSEGAFLTELPYLLLKKGDVAKLPWLTTYTTGEGGLSIMDYQKNLAFFNENWDSVLPYYLDYNRTVEDSDKKAVADAIKKFYFNNEEVTEDNLIKLVRLCGHRYFDIPFEIATKMQSHFAPVYGYLFGYHMEFDNNMPFKLDKKYGVIHAGDGSFLYDMDFRPMTTEDIVFSGTSLEVKDIMMDIVTSFAKSGIPSVKGLEWPPVKPGDFKYLYIDEERKILSNEIDAEIKRFWDSLPIKEYGNSEKIKDEL